MCLLNPDSWRNVSGSDVNMRPSIMAGHHLLCLVFLSKSPTYGFLVSLSSFDTQSLSLFAPNKIYYTTRCAFHVLLLLDGWSAAIIRPYWLLLSAFRHLHFLLHFVRLLDRFIFDHSYHGGRHQSILLVHPHSFCRYYATTNRYAQILELLDVLAGSLPLPDRRFHHQRTP